MAVKKVCSGFSLVEVMVVTVLFSIVMATVSMVFVSGQQIFLDNATKSEVQANVMQGLHRVSFELQNSGYDAAGTFQVALFDNAGEGGTDILRFAIPMCLCGTLPFDPASSVRAWGAPLIWDQTGCDTQAYPVGSNGKVDLCHFPPGNPGHPVTLSVSVNAVQAHLAHGDYIGSCGTCDPGDQTNKAIEYLVDAQGQLLRRVLDPAGAVVKSDIMARDITAFQVVMDSAVAPAQHRAANISVGASKKGARGRAASITNDVDVLFRNR